MVFRLISTSVTLNVVIVLILLYFTEFGRFVDDSQWLSREYSLLLLAILTHLVVRSLCDS